MLKQFLFFSFSFFFFWFLEKVTIASQIDLFGRTFPASFKAYDVVMQWPVALGRVECPPQAAASEKIQLIAGVRNKSLLPYGIENRNVQVNWKLDRFVMIL
jgi:hypothetical protein